MRSAGIAGLLAAHRTRDRGGELSALWKEALDYCGLVETFQEIDALQAEYYREKSIHQALLAALEFHARS